jgi:hypothetical protein
MKQFFVKNWFKIGVLLILAYLAVARSPLHINFGRQSPKAQAETITETLPVATSGSEASILSSSSGDSKSLVTTLAKVSDADKEAYLKRFAKVAMQEQQKFGLPASVMLSIALLHSESGQRDITVSGNNHFGLLSADKSPKKYDRAWDSFRDFSNLVAAKLTDKPTKAEAEAWLKALSKAGLVGGEQNDLEQLIKHFNLSELDTMAPR